VPSRRNASRVIGFNRERKMKEFRHFPADKLLNRNVPILGKREELWELSTMQPVIPNICPEKTGGPHR